MQSKDCHVHFQHLPFAALSNRLGFFLLHGFIALLYAICKDECRENAIHIFFLNTKPLLGINAELKCDQPDSNLHNFDIFQGNKIIHYRT